MAATPPRPASPVSPPVKSAHALQISPNLEALLEHDELTRRNSNSPTNTFTTTSPAFPISLPPPPPRKAQIGRKTAQREHESSLPTTRSKEGQWVQRKALGSDFWPDGLPAGVPPDPSAAEESSSSRPVTPNPYLNPAPVLTTQPHSDISRDHVPLSDDVQTPRQAHKFESSQSAAEARGPLDSPCRSPPALNRVEKILWMGRDSLSLFGSGNGSKRHDSDRRYDRHVCGHWDAVQDRQMQQVPAQNVSDSRPASWFGDIDTATLSSRSGTSYLQALKQRSSVVSETASTRSSSISSEPPAHLLPRLSPMPYDSPRPQSVSSGADHDYQSFIDFCSPSTSDDSSNFCNVQDKSQENPSRRHLQPISIPPSSLYCTPSLNLSSTSLASMRFAPPSPTSLPVRPPSPMRSPSDSSSSVALSTMVFAPPSPSTEHIAPTWLQPFSGPPSPHSPLEFAPPPCSPQEIVSARPIPTRLQLASDRGRKLKSEKRSMSLSPHPVHHHLLSPLPPTTNQLGANERADRIRRTRKLARVFGRLPGTYEPVTDAEGPSKKSRSPSLAALLTKHKNHRHAVSVSAALESPGMKTEPCTPWQTDGLWSPDGRRHSIPLTTGSFTLYVDDEHGKAIKDPRRTHHIMDSPETASTRSFIDLSDEESRDHDDDVSAFHLLSPVPHQCRCLHQSSSTPSLVESLDSVAQAEADKRRKREKVAKLHRFLGSRVPPEAIIGNVFGPPLPPAAVLEPPTRDHRHRGHRSVPSDDFDRCKEELDEKEKALNVRRAQKMERVFGTPPPQKLFHTRPSRPTVPFSQPTSPTGFNPYVLSLDIPSSSLNPNRSSYLGKTIYRRGPSDSSRCLLPRIDDTPQSSPTSFAQSFADSFAQSLSGYQQVLAQSSVYLNYQHSLNSLVDIIDRDDRRSLVELHRLLHGGVDESPLEEEEAPVDPRRISIATSVRSERRHSLPSKSSMTSLSSEFLVSPKASRFQIRRRTAAKLTNFFGVDYRELIRDILESIEKGVEDERKQGTLQPQEVEVLMHRVRSLRTIRDPFRG